VCVYIYILLHLQVFWAHSSKMQLFRNGQKTIQTKTCTSMVRTDVPHKCRISSTTVQGHNLFITLHMKHNIIIKQLANTACSSGLPLN